MKRKALSLLLLSFFVLIVAACTSAPTEDTSDTASSSPSNAVSIENNTFTPETLTIKVGETVTWMNNDSVMHNVVADEFSSDNLSNGDSFEFTFEEAGTYTYICSIHPAMSGEIIVE